MTIYSLLKADHRKVKALLMKLTKRTNERAGGRREKLLSLIQKDLVAHNRAEEELFYSKLKKSKKSCVLSIEGACEHDIGDRLMKELSVLDGTSDEFAAKTKVLRELVEHHIKEEESEIHEQARKELTMAQAIEIGEQFVILKKKLLTGKIALNASTLKPNQTTPMESTIASEAALSSC